LALVKLLLMEDVKMGNNGIYKTSDLYIAAWLLSKFLELQDVERYNTRRRDFHAMRVFQNDSN